ncbi:PREDICTED: peroxidase 40-like [Camelina sativa]|uniref:Peroxidase n=1 Tax=Camelina sativa TaxID=90675 RepID=A0ABM0UEZ4_CAMSA|nr:PREDICTED: peroxidase 40-like [Camelina sativa]
MKKLFNYLFLMLFAAMPILSLSESNPTNFSETCEDGSGETGSSFGIGFGLVLDFGLYRNSCPEAESIVYSWVQTAVLQDPRMAASLLRLHFHDCFVNGCDASVLLDDTEGLVGEKTAPPNLNSLRGFEVIDSIKSDLESVCPETVSCADILAMAARDSVVVSGGPSWEVEVGRKDSRTASKPAATTGLPSPNSTVPTLISIFQKLGLSQTDMVALSGGHTLGKARCTSFTARLLPLQTGEPANHGDNLDFLESLQQLCSTVDPAVAITQLDLVTPSTFDNQYYVNLLSGEGLLPSDQALAVQDPGTRAIVETYAADQSVFFEDFKNAMVKMGGITGGSNSEIRRNCRMIN